MKYSNFSKLIFLSLISCSQLAFASDTMIAKGDDSNTFMNSGFQGSQNITLPFNTITPIFGDRNFGNRNGDIGFTPKGIRIKKSGDYIVTFKVSLTDQSQTENQLFNTVTIAVKLNKGLDLNNPLTIYGYELFYEGESHFIQGTGVIKGIEKDTNLSLVGINEGFTDVSMNAVIDYWELTAVRIED